MKEGKVVWKGEVEGEMTKNDLSNHSGINDKKYE